MVFYVTRNLHIQAFVYIYVYYGFKSKIQILSYINLWWLGYIFMVQNVCGGEHWQVILYLFTL